MAFVSYFDQPAQLNTKETFADMYENRLGMSFFPPEWQEAHQDRPPLPPDYWKAKVCFDSELNAWVRRDAEGNVIFV